MNFALMREIYGLTAWFVDSASLPGLLGVIDNAGHIEIPEIKYNTPEIIINREGVASETRVVTDPYGNGWYDGELENNDNFSAIAVIKINGPITLNGGASSIGMKQLSEMMLKMNEDSRVKAFIVYADSGGGASGAVEVMSDTINQIKEEKPVIGLVQKGGMAASACYGILSACTQIYSESEMNIVGSAGTMIQFAGRKANVEDEERKIKYVRLYASKSTKKNEGFEEALNNDNYEVLIDGLLDPINERFLTLIESNRPALEGTDFNDGHTVFSKDAIGTFLDGIKSFDEVVESLTAEIQPSISFNNNFNNSSTMNKADFISKHPELYNEVMSDGKKAGVLAERDRSGAWLAHIGTDPKAVLEGIESGEAITATQTQQFIVKQAANAQLKNLADDSPEAIAAAEAAKKKADDPDNAVDAFYANIDKKLNINQKQD